MALYYRSKKKSLLERLHELFHTYGWYKEIQISKTFKGEKGLLLMEGLMSKLRKHPPKEMAGKKVFLLKDYLLGKTVNLETGNEEKNIDLPPSNVLQFLFKNGSQVSVRPSGTEPKIKFYISLCTLPGVSEREANRFFGEEIEELSEGIEKLINV